MTASILAAFGLVTIGSHPVRAQSLADVLAQMKQMQKHIDQLEAEVKQQRQSKPKSEPVKANAPAVVAAPVVVAAAPAPDVEYVKKGAIPGSYLVPGTNTSVKIGGYIKADGIYDTGPQQGDSIDPGATPLRKTNAGRQSAGNFRFTARESRFNIKTFTPTDYGDVKTTLEGDFYGSNASSLSTNSYGLRLRQAFGEIGPFTAGQTWTTFMDVDALPETLDFNGPTGQVLVRQPVFRYTYDGKALGSFAIALESPQGDFLNADSSVPSSNASNPTPDFIAKWVYPEPFGHISLSALGRTEQVDTGIVGASKPSIFGYGLEFATVIENFWGKDSIMLEIAGGDGMGRYFFDNGGGSNLSGGGYSAATAGLGTTQPTITAQSSVGGYVAYQHFWTDSIRSTAVYGRQENYINNAIAHVAGVDYNRLMQTIHANLIWSPIPKVDVGAEYIYTKRDNTLHQYGEANRIQVSVKYAF
jgi:hypothetical protein